MNKKELKTALFGLVVGILSGYIVLLLPLPASPPKTEPQLRPRLMHVQHQESAHEDDLVMVTMR